MYLCCVYNFSKLRYKIWHVWSVIPFAFKTSSPFISFWMSFFQLISPTTSLNIILEWHGSNLCDFNTFNLNCWRVIDNPTICMLKFQATIAPSSSFVNTPCKPIFLVMVLPLRWFKSEVKRMFQFLLTCLKEVCPFTTFSIVDMPICHVHVH